MDRDSLEALLKSQSVSRESLPRFQTYVVALTTWQKRINLIGPSTIDEIWTRHVLDGLQVITHLPGETRAVADLGSGAGIPGLIVAIATGVKAHLYESNGKKAAFLRHVARATGAEVTIHEGRVEDLALGARIPEVQAVLARALAPLPLLLEYAAPFISRGAVGLFHKGQDVDKELTDATKYWKIRVIKHPSVTDSRGVILEVREAWRV